MSEANNALAWIVFQRDRSRFEVACPEWKIEAITLTMPFRYLLSGGVASKLGMPGWSFPAFRGVETLMKPLWPALAMFAKIRLKRAK